MSRRRERFERLYGTCYGPLLGYARRRTDSIEDARDVVSETFATAWRRLDDVPDGDLARLWLFGTAHKTLANHHRGRQRFQRLTERLQREPGAEAQQNDLCVENDETVLIAAAFGRLGEADQEVLVLAGWEQLDAGQIAVVFGCTRANARLRLYRARKRFAAALADQGLELPTMVRDERSRGARVRPGSKETR